LVFEAGDEIAGAELEGLIFGGGARYRYAIFGAGEIKVNLIALGCGLL